MARVTPKLDHLTEVVRGEFLRNITLLDMATPGLPRGITMRQMLASRSTASTDTSSYLQLSSLAGTAILILYRLRRDKVSRRNTDEEILDLAMQHPAFDGIGADITANVRALTWDVEEYLIGLIAEIARACADVDVGELLVELWHISDEEFDPDAPGSELDYNADDGTPDTFDTPHNYLLDIIMDTITARLMKRHGPELLLAWSDAVGDARR